MNIIAGYQDVVGRLQAKGIKVYGATIISALGMNNPAEGWNLIDFPDFLLTPDNGPVTDRYRQQINHYIRTSGLFDGVVDFDQATLDPTTSHMKAVYVPNSAFTQFCLGTISTPIMPVITPWAWPSI